MANPNDVSQGSIIRPQGAQQPTFVSLPTRGEKRLIPSPVNAAGATAQIINGLSVGKSAPGVLTVTDYIGAYNVSAAKEPLTDFVVIYIQNRGMDNQGNPDPVSNAVYRFLINPRTVNIQRTTLNGEAFARSGWKFGLWGEDMVRISLSGKTAGRYFALGLTDEFAEFTESFRNLEQLIDVFENNGYWFEGEQVDYGTLSAPNYARRQVKMHQDVILAVKEFLWFGMFESLDVTENADMPFYADFTLTFIAWKERFRGDSPYYNAIANNTQRGNSYSAFENSQGKMITSAPFPQTGPNSGQTQTATAIPAGSTTATSPAAAAELASNQYTSGVNPMAQDFSPTQPLFNSDSTYFNDWNGIQD